MRKLHVKRQEQSGWAGKKAQWSKYNFTWLGFSSFRVARWADFFSIHRFWCNCHLHGLNGGASTFFFAPNSTTKWAQYGQEISVGTSYVPPIRAVYCDADPIYFRVTLFSHLSFHLNVAAFHYICDCVAHGWTRNSTRNPTANFHFISCTKLSLKGWHIRRCHTQHTE